MGFIEVVCMSETAQKTPPIGYASWLEYWELSKEKPAKSCEVMSCAKLPEIAGLVMKASEVGKIAELGTVCVLPMCKSCYSALEGYVFKAWESDLLLIK